MTKARVRTVGLIVLSCAVPRLLALAIFPHPQDTLYREIADNLVAGRGYTLSGGAATYLEPLYPALLAAGGFVGGSAGMLILQIGIACAGALALFAVARRRAGERTAWVATLLYALSPYLIRQAVAFMEITVATTVAIVTVWSVDRALERGAAGWTAGGRGALAGLAVAALLLTRASFLPVALGAVALLAARGSLTAAAAAAIAAAALVTPWLLYSRAASGDALPQRMGENLFVTTSALGEGIVPRINTDVLQPAAHDLAFSALGPSAGTAERDRFLLRESIAYAKTHPLAVARLKLRNVAAVFQPRLVPFTELRGRAFVEDGVVRVPPQASRPLAFDVVAAAYQTLLLGGAAIGLWRRRAEIARADAMLVVVGGSVIAVNVAFFPTSRLLAPMTFVAMFYTAVASGR